MELLSQSLELKDNLVRLSLEASSLLESLMMMVKGTVMEKYAFKHGKKQAREFSISSDLLHFQWKPEGSSRKIRKYTILEISEVVPGNSEFQCKNHADIRQDSESLCFTIKLKGRPVNIVASTTKIRDAWVFGLRMLKKEEKTQYCEDIQNLDLVLTEKIKSVKEKSMIRSAGSFMIEDEELSKLKKRVKELEKSNSRLQKELFEINSKADKDSIAGDELKKEIKSKEKAEKKLQGQIELLNLQFENQEKDYSHKILIFEERLSLKDNKLLELQTEYDEFKKQIKESFNRTLVSKVQQYRESKEILCSYVNCLKERLETIEKEVALWQAVVYSHVLPIYQSKKTGRPPVFKQVLEFALDNMEKKLLTDRSQTQFLTLLTEARRNSKVQ